MDYFKFLPGEIILDILSRLAVESVLNSKSVCTNWASLVRHQSFSKMHFLHHLNHSNSGEFGFISLAYNISDKNDENGYLWYSEFNENNESAPIQRIMKINFIPPFKNMSISFVGSCNGIICIAQGPSVCICNPITREYVMLPEIIKRDSCNDNGGYSYGATIFGYVSSTNEYKVVGIYDSKNMTHVQIHIYTLGSGSGWRNLGNFNFGSSPNFFEKVFFANEALYWLDDELETIVTFDLAEENFSNKLSPPPLPPDSNWFSNRIGVLNGFLFYAIGLYGEKDGFNDLWLLKQKNDSHGMKVRDGHQSLGWSKGFRIGSSVLLALTKSDGVLTYNNWYIKIYDTKTSASKRLMKLNNWWLSQVSPHKNTFFSLKELGEEDTKAMESIEIEETKGHGQLEEDANPEYLYL